MGIAAALFFAITFILNRSMSLSGSSWIWSASLRFYWMAPLLILIVGQRRGLGQLLREIKGNYKMWLLWSTVGFGLFYAPLTYSAAYSPSWLLSGTWQFTIIAGIIMAPFLSKGKKNTIKVWQKPALFSGVIITGVIFMMSGQSQLLSASEIMKGTFPVIIAAFAYPLGNRKMMSLAGEKLDVFQRILGMVLCSMPFWLILCAYEYLRSHSLPENSQLLQTFIVGIFSGVIATSLFFAATQKVRNNNSQLAAVEATQATEILFACIGEMVLLEAALPDTYGIVGIVLVVIGMTLHSIKRK
jgi:hypothetical protein